MQDQIVIRQFLKAIMASYSQIDGVKQKVKGISHGKDCCNLPQQWFHIPHFVITTPQPATQTAF